MSPSSSGRCRRPFDEFRAITDSGWIAVKSAYYPEDPPTESYGRSNHTMKFFVGRLGLTVDDYASRPFTHDKKIFTNK